MIRRPMAIAALVVSLFAASAQAQPVAVTTCGETIDNGFLVGDLDCSAASGFAVTVTNRGSLDLAGFQLVGTSDHSVDWQNPVYGGGVHCLGACTVTGGGGAIVSPAGVPEQSTYSIGFYSNPPSGPSRVFLNDITFSGWSYGVWARVAEVSNCQFTGNWLGIVIDRKVAMDNCTLTGNTYEGAHLDSGVVSNSVFDGNGVGFYALRKIKLISSSASNNQDRGVYASRIRALDSAIDNNCISPTPDCADIEGRQRPRLVNTTCATSYNDLTEADWDVCSED